MEQKIAFRALVSFLLSGQSPYFPAFAAGVEAGLSLADPDWSP